MLKTNAKKNIRRLIAIIVLTAILLVVNINVAMAVNDVSSNIEKEKKDSTASNYVDDINDEAEVSNAIRNLILTINSEGMNKNLLSQILNLYTQLAKSYTNTEIVEMIEQHRHEFEQNNVKMDNIDSVTNLLKIVDTNKLNKIVSQIDVNEISAKIENGENIQAILNSITGTMTPVEKVNFVMDILLSAQIVKAIAIILIVLFIYRTLLRCVIYKKAGKKAWAPFIPIYRNVVMLKICGMSPWWLLLLLIPVIGWILLFVVSVASKFMLAEAFGKGTGVAFGLWLLAPIFETMIVFSRKTKYIGF